MPLSCDAIYREGLEIEAPARLHMGFLDMDGSLGRRFGSLGVGIEGLSTRITIRPQSGCSVEGPDRDRALEAIETLERRLDHRLVGEVVIEECVPQHAGLGSGTQMALAVGVAMAQFNGVPLSAREVAIILGRGRRSGIGIAVFEAGGLVLDAGRGEMTRVPPVISRISLPDHWRFIVLMDPGHQGLHGPKEIEAFRRLPPFPREVAANLCHGLLMKGLPAVLENDLETFGKVIEDLQTRVGDHFAPAQGGRFSSSRVSESLAFLSALGAHGVGQSSWGPTGFCLAESQAQAEAWVRRLEIEWGSSEGLSWIIAAPRREGAKLKALSV